ncbi:hypothetical protein D9M72_560500 [compost metagenome]
MLAGVECCAGGVVAILRRHAERYRVDRWDGFQHRFDRLEIIDAIDGAVAAGRGNQPVVAVFGNGRQVLVTNDLADADKRDLNWRHGVSLILV